MLAFEEEKINTLHLPLCHAALWVQVSLSAGLLAIVTIWSKSKTHDYAVTLKHHAMFTRSDQRFSFSFFLRCTVIAAAAWRILHAAFGTSHNDTVSSTPLKANYQAMAATFPSNKIVARYELPTLSKGAKLNAVFMIPLQRTLKWCIREK